MNGGLLQTSPVQQIIAGNPNLWSTNNIMRPPTHQQTSPFLLPPPTLFPQFTPSSSSSSPPLSSSSSSLPVPSCHDNQDKLPESWSQLLLGGLLVGDEDKVNLNSFQARTTTSENWEEQVLHQASSASLVDVKQENFASSYMYGQANEDLRGAKQPSWSHLMPASSPKSSCVTISSNMLDFSASKGDGRHPPPDRSPECNSNGTGGAPKKARVQPSTTQSTFKVRKEKLGDRITALHQLVSPFGKTDTASVLFEAIEYIRFLQNQIEALSLPYLGSGSATMRRQQLFQGEKNCIFPEDPGQLLNDNRIKTKGTRGQDSHGEPKKDLRNRGLCLVPVACTLDVGSDNGADYWSHALGGKCLR